MPVVKKQTGSVKKPQPISPKKPITPISKPVKAVIPAPKQPVKPAPTGAQVQSGQAGTEKVNSQGISTATTKPPLPKAAPVTPTKPQLASGKPTPKPVSLRYEQELLNNPMLKKIDLKMKEHPDLFGAVLRGSDSLEKAFDKMFAMWGRDEEMDAKALKAFKTNGNFRQQDNVDEDELTDIVAEVLIDWNKMVASHSVEPNQHSVAAFRVLSDLVASYTGDNLDDYLYVMNTLLLRYSTSGDAGMIATVGIADLTGNDLPNVLPPYISSIQIGTEDLSHDYFDEGDQNQIGHHLWAYIATGASPGNNAWLNDDLTGTLWRNDLLGIYP
jgi:hypothetical protein